MEVESIIREYNILGKLSVERFHNNKKCLKVWNGTTWTGECPDCVEYANLWKDNQQKLAIRLKPIEKHTFLCAGKEPLICGKTVAAKIGNRTGNFVLVETTKFGYEKRYNCYDESHFAGD